MEQLLPTLNLSNILREFDKSKGELALSKQELQDNFGVDPGTIENLITEFVATGYFVFVKGIEKLMVNPQRKEIFLTRPKIVEEEAKVLLSLGVVPPFGTWRNHIKIEGGHVTELRLPRQGLRSIPESIGSLSHLKVLDLHQNQLKFLPDAIAELKQLVILNLENNPLEGFPAKVGELPSLNYIYLEGNDVDTFHYHYFKIPDTLQTPLFPPGSYIAVGREGTSHRELQRLTEALRATEPHETDKIIDLKRRISVFDTIDLYWPRIRKRYGVQEISYSAEWFLNHLSRFGFVCGKYSSLYTIEEIITKDELELARKSVQGTFAEVADVMGHLVEYAEKYHVISACGDLFDTNPFLNTHHWLDDEFRENILLPNLHRTILDDPHTGHFGRGIYVANVFHAPHPWWKEAPLQLCPFLTCNFMWNDDYLIFNKLTEKFLLVNRGTEHLAREHHLLEKGNGYGISAVDFYRHFAEPILQI